MSITLSTHAKLFHFAPGAQFEMGSQRIPGNQFNAQLLNHRSRANGVTTLPAPGNPILEKHYRRIAEFIKFKGAL
jgi:hypothetical protein